MFDGGRAGLEQVRMEWYDQLLAQFKNVHKHADARGVWRHAPHEVFLNSLF